ncbi:MAG: hypothetical protein M0C28_45640 [Candidatus Moduliflexus flocculans]|nr:hypothetical protein [Candidatus Moduliflexus flocculans]
MLRGRVRLKRLALSDVILDLSREDLPGPLPTGSSDSRRDRAASNRPGPGARLRSPGARLLDLYFALIPDSLEIERLTLHSVFGDVRQGLYFPRLDIRGSAFETKLEVFDQGAKWAYLLGRRDRKGGKAARVAPAAPGAQRPGRAAVRRTAMGPEGRFRFPGLRPAQPAAARTACCAWTAGWRSAA